MSIWTVLMIAAIIILVVIPSFKDRVMPVKKLLITPAIFMYLFYQTIDESFNISLIHHPMIIGGLITGIAIGILIRSKTVIKSDKHKQLIWLPGSYLSLFIFMLIFSIHYVIGYLQAVYPNYLTQTSFGVQVLLFFISSASSMIIGANGLLYAKYLMCESSDFSIN
ncbi:MAG: hypothetical protein ACD_46C00186G0003 [uncultured bacterium]|nr:MAG: hypothetical protein ACD_46C00186G0003 [uncultured bacterium]